MKFIPTKVHGYLDYLVSALLIAAPWLFGFANDGAETWVPVLLGGIAILYSLFSNYELGVVHQLSMRTHLVLDLIHGIFLAASPWIFGFADTVWAPHLVFGLLEIGVSLMTKREPQHSTGKTTAAH
ncbi:MAG: SPW repeat protein [Flavisolibacter sp.]|nr:SPW repeat protein [Flavisolibacter sp.]